MDLLQNPFHILTATTRDNRQKIAALAEERILSMDSNECTQARSDLTHPRKRLSAELAWLPRVEPEYVSKVLELLKSPPLFLFDLDYFKNLIGLDQLVPIAQANLLAAGLSRIPDYSSEDMVERIVEIMEWIVEIAYVFEHIDPKEIGAIVNEERIVSGFPTVIDLSTIEMEIKERRSYYQQVITSALSNLSVKERVRIVTVVVEGTTNNGEHPGLTLIDDLVASYEIDAQKFLEQEERNIERLAEKLRAAVDAKSRNLTLALIVNQLIQAVKNWDTFAQPIQVNRKIQGLFHDASYRVAGQMRALAVDLFNKYDELNLSQQLINLLQEVFAEVGTVAERIAEDARKLDEIAEQRAQLDKFEALVEEFRRLETEIDDLPF